MTNDQFITIAEFQKLTGVSDRALIEILARNLVELRVNPETGLQLNISSCDLNTLIQSNIPTQIEDILSNRRLLLENVAEIIDEHLDDILNEALQKIQRN